MRFRIFDLDPDSGPAPSDRAFETIPSSPSWQTTRLAFWNALLPDVPP